MSTKTKSTTKTKTPKTKPAGQPTRHEQLIEMLRRPEGVTIAQVQEAFGILPHSARAQISMLGKKLGHRIDAARPGKGEAMVYRLPAAG